MSQWKNTDSAANSPFTAVAAFKTPANTTTQAAIFANTTTGAIRPNLKIGVFGVDVAEAAAESAITHAGWVVRKEGTGGRAGRVQYETLVAMGSISTDAEDTVLKDVKLTFTVQPASKNVASGATTFTTSVANSGPTTVTYAWQANTGAGFVALTNAGVYSNVATPVLSISNVAGLTGVQYRVLASSTDANTITSKAATLTVA